MSNDPQKQETPTTNQKPAAPSTDSDHVMQFFEFAHLPDHLREISQPFAQMAHWIVAHVPRNPERTKALNKLLEAKDCAVRARTAK